MQSITVVINRQPSIAPKDKSQMDYFHSGDGEDSIRKPRRSLSTPIKKDKSDSKKRSVKKSISFGQKHEGQRPTKRKPSKIKSKQTKPLPDLQEEDRIQKLPQRSTSHKASSSDDSEDLQEEFRRERRSRQSHNRRESSRTSSDALDELREEFRRDREKRERKSFNKKRSPKTIDSSAPRPRRSSSVEVKSSDQEELNGKLRGRLRRSSSSTSLDSGHRMKRRSISRNYRKSPTPREWYQQLQQNEDSRVERPSVPTRSISKNSKSPKVRESSRKSFKQVNEDDQSRKPLVRKSTSFRKKSFGPGGGQDGVEATTPMEWHQHFQRREDQQTERPRSKRSLKKKPSVSKERKDDEQTEERLRRRERSTSARRSSSIRRSNKSPRRSRRSPTPKIPLEFYIVEDDTERRSNRRCLGEKSASFRKTRPQAHEDEEERPSSRRSLGKKSASFRRRQHQYPIQNIEVEEERSRPQPHEDEEERPSSRRSLGKKTASFRRRQHQCPIQEIEVEEERPSSRRSLGKKSLSFKRKNGPAFFGSGQDQDDRGRRISLPQRLTSFPTTFTQPSRRLSLGKKVSLRNLFGSKNEQSGKENKVDWKEWGFQECSYYQNSSNNDSPSSVKRKTSDTIKRLSSLTRLTSLSRKNEDAWDDGIDREDPESEKTPGPLTNWSAFLRDLDGKRNRKEEEEVEISFTRPYDDISIHAGSPMRATCSKAA